MGFWKRIRGVLARRPADTIDLQSPSLLDSLAALLTQLQGKHIDSALVGGVALAARGVIRGTRDIDLLIAREDEPTVHALMCELGFETLDRGAHVSSYLLQHLRVDLLWARRAYGREMIERADPVTIKSNLSAKVVCVEDLIGLKLQAMVSNRDRGKDRNDVLALLRTHAATVTMETVQSYARAVGAEDELKAIMELLADHSG
ncbi:MAG: hypothetical protein A2289_13075 [Deltaproteobacteria bacterium RIFOXYA12_FULL_58_15]|nr:MAG: hypothetical protein A2289_13075 [Deltaproteobacteria bacterium RIFOXYA12_FULL_58_15]OGR09425.1 MAG: hypothetical protein A2341_18055 [Deltaproteobacteria bacterium RIFOXYB12_FULL_58_9]